MQIKGLMDECFNDYKKPAMYIAFPSCTFKCDKLNNCQICQNWQLSQAEVITIDKNEIIERYLKNPITEAIILSGLEPFDSILDLLSFVSAVRNDYHCADDIVIYTGYTEEELRTGNFDNVSTTAGESFWQALIRFPNIIVKFGRFIMNQESHYDDTLGIKLASPNQYARKVSTVDEQTYYSKES